MYANEQPWRYIVATRSNADEFARLLSCLVEGNQPWAKTAPVLALGCVSKNFVRNGTPNAAAEHDLGAASASLSVEATARGLFVHQMIGILPYGPASFTPSPTRPPLTGLAIGYLGDPNSLPENYKQVTCAPASASRPRNSSSAAAGAIQPRLSSKVTLIIKL